MNNIITIKQYDNINSFCKEYNIDVYTINSDGSIDVNGNVLVHHSKLKTLPFKFGKISGTFTWCDGNLTSFKNFPSECSKFYCHYNKITSLENCPLFINNDLDNYNFYKNNFPEILTRKLLDKRYNQENINTFIKYQDHFDVWNNNGVNEFNEEGFNELMDEIEDGLR
jgi:hypothetical protein